MQRLPELEHRVVRRVDDRVDRAHARGGDVAPGRAAARADAPPRGRSAPGTADMRRAPRSPPRRPPRRPRRSRPPTARARAAARLGRGGDLPRHAEHRQEVRPVGLHLDVEHREVELQRVTRDRSPARGPRRSGARSPRGRCRSRARAASRACPRTRPRGSLAARAARASTGTRAPGGAHGTRSPAAMFRTPTTSSASPDPCWIRATQSLSELGWSRTSRTRTTTTPSRPAHGTQDRLPPSRRGA